MALKIYNTLSQKKELFQPIHPPTVSFYTCGVTVYDDCHIGHARTYMAVDMMTRYLTHLEYQVNSVRNITDIDDKIIKRAQERGEDFTAIVAEFTRAMHDDFAALQLIAPQNEPRATDYLAQMITLIEKMIANQHAYVASNGDVYFRVRSHARYGALSHHHLDQLESGARVEIVDVKEDPLDFVLWKLAKPNEPHWSSPWGEGRPGWHTECTAMALDLLGDVFDIHAGGRDLIFPHHENEIAQAEAAVHAAFAKTWVHMGFLQVEKEKMSKSLRNFITIRQALEKHHPEILRYLFTASHYRSPLVYTEDAMMQAKQALNRLYAALRFMPIRGEKRLLDSSYEKAFREAMDDDFNTPLAISVLFDLAHEVQKKRDEAKVDDAIAHAALLQYLGGILGLLQQDPELFFQASNDLDVEKIEALIAARQRARLDKDWAKADDIRKQLADLSVIIEDNAKGTTWRKK